MSPVVNPFSNINFKQAIVTQGRESRLFSALISEGGAVEIYGERGMGKSLMLNYIANPPAAWQEAYFQDYIFVFCNCQDRMIPPTAGNFWLQVTRQLDRKLESGPIQQKCQALLGRVGQDAELDCNDFHEVLDVAAGALKRIVLVLDDFDCLIRTTPPHLDETRAFLQGLRSLKTKDSNLANLVTATRDSLRELCKPLALPEYSAFYNGFFPCRLRCFSEKELLLLLQRVEETGQPAFSPAEVRYVAYLSGSYPKLAQLAAAEIFDQRIEAGAPLSDLTIVGERFKAEASSLFERLWQGALEVERLLLMLVALQAFQGKVPTAQYDLSDLPEIFSQRERELIELTERGLLNRVQADPPRWAIFSPIFQWWIVKEIESGDPEQLAQRRKVWGNLVTQQRADRLGEVVEWLKQHQDAIASLGQYVLRATGQQLPKLPED